MPVDDLVERLRAIQQVTASLHLAEDADQMLNQVLDAILEVLGFDYVAVSLVDREKETISTEYGRTKAPDIISLAWLPESRYRLDAEDILAITVRENRPQLAEGWDKRLNRNIFEKYQHENLSRAYVPIPARGDHAVGVIEAGFDLRGGKHFKKAQLFELESFAVHVGIAIENSRVLSSVKEMAVERARYEQLEQLTPLVQQVFSSLPNTEYVLRVIADGTRKYLNAHSVAILPISDLGKLMRELVTISPEILQGDYIPAAPRGNGAIQRAWENGYFEVADTEDTQEYPFLADTNFAQTFGIRAYSAARLQAGEKIFGVMFVNYDERRELDQSEKAFLHNVSIYAAGVIQHADLLALERQRAEDLSRLVRLSETLTTSFSVNMVLNTVLKQLKQIVPNEQCVVWLVDTEEKAETGDTALVPRGAAGRYAETISKMRLSQGDGIVGKTAQSESALLIQDVAKFAGAAYVPGTDPEEDQSMIAVPLRFEEDLMGVIAVSRFGLGKFDEESDGPLMELVGDILGAALKIGFLLEDVEQKERELLRRQELLDQELDMTWEDRGERYAGMFFYNTVAHDIRNVLTIIAGELSSLQKNPRFNRALSKQAMRRFNRGKHRIDISRDAIVGFLELTRTSGAPAQLVRPNVIVRRALHLMQMRLEFNEVGVVKDLAPNLPRIRINLFRAIEIVLNLFTNAIKAMQTIPSSRRVLTVSSHVDPDGKVIQIRVTDTGIGIKKEHMNRLFTYYHTWWPSTQPGGIGVGLHFSKLMVERLGGRLDLIDTRFGHGSTFQLQLPIPSEEDLE